MLKISKWSQNSLKRLPSKLLGKNWFLNNLVTKLANNFRFYFRVFLLFTFGMVLAAAIFSNDEVSNKETKFINKNNFSSMINNNNNDDSEPNHNHSTVPHKTLNCVTSSTINSKESLWTIHRFVRCFSISKNAKSILCTKTSPNAMPSLNAFK